MLFDEPTSALDPEMVGSLKTMQGLADSMTMVIVYSRNGVLLVKFLMKFWFMADGCWGTRPVHKANFENPQSPRARFPFLSFININVSFK